VRNGVRRVFAYGAVKPDSIFEIGSITKTFTGLVLAQLIAQGQVHLDEPVRELLPSGTVAKPQGTEITLLDLITHHSGFPRMPDNFNPADKSNPYLDYRATNLYHFVAKHGVEKPADAPFVYSNLGVGLLGQALANHAAMPYANLLKEEVTEPLRLHDTVVAISPAQQERFSQGPGPEHAWDFDALAGAGGIRSTADDMLTYLEANLHPAKLAVKASASPSARTLPAALALSHELRADAAPGVRIAFAWNYDSATGSYWHGGATGGYSSFAFFNPSCDCAGVVLMNTTRSIKGSFADLLGQHIDQRFAGRPAVSLFN
jgi:serine-type D-Ala-D-Ala carboxypeptidase/endopeptidase